MSEREELSERVAHAMYVAEYPWWNELGWDHWSDGSMASMGLRDRCFAMVDAVLAELERMHIVIDRERWEETADRSRAEWLEIWGDEDLSPVSPMNWYMIVAIVLGNAADFARDAPAGEGESD